MFERHLESKIKLVVPCEGFYDKISFQMKKVFAWRLLASWTILTRCRVAIGVHGASVRDLSCCVAKIIKKSLGCCSSADLFGSIDASVMDSRSKDEDFKQVCSRRAQCMNGDGSSFRYNDWFAAFFCLNAHLSRPSFNLLCHIFLICLQRTLLAPASGRSRNWAGAGFFRRRVVQDSPVPSSWLLQAISVPVVTLATQTGFLPFSFIPISFNQYKTHPVV